MTNNTETEEPITKKARKLIQEEWTEDTINAGLSDTLRYLRSYEAALSALEARNRELVEALERLRKASGYYITPKDVVAAIENGVISARGWNSSFSEIRDANAQAQAALLKEKAGK